ncbi:unnamed protein product [Parnassius apollo]|uniref:(apollo) hypothetical protein n=1 Tax=Parnassius apollo TaxID=110799 RepID=A0A8S3W9S9_PARAO|nr:unnamed protein product [Parnassius apollo]
MTLILKYYLISNLFRYIRKREVNILAPKESGANDEEVISMYPNFDDEEDDESNNDDDSDCQSDIGYTTEEEYVHSCYDDDDNDNDNVDNDDEAVDDNDN